MRFFPLPPARDEKVRGHPRSPAKGHSPWIARDESLCVLEPALLVVSQHED